LYADECGWNFSSTPEEVAEYDTIGRVRVHLLLVGQEKGGFEFL